MRKGILAVMLLCSAAVANAGDVVADWGTAVPPKTPALTAVTVDAKTTALLILDIEELTCNKERRPRCLDTVPKIEALLKKSRDAGMHVLYSTTPRGTPESILPPVKPLASEPVVKSSVNKFLSTTLDQLLRERKVTKVIITGTAAHGAVLHTLTHAAQMGYDIILPADGLSAEDTYTEQASVALSLTGPATRAKTTLTRTDMITIQK